MKASAEDKGGGRRWEYTDGAGVVVFLSTHKVTAPRHAEMVHACFLVGWNALSPPRTHGHVLLCFPPLSPDYSGTFWSFSDSPDCILPVCCKYLDPSSIIQYDIMHLGVW